MSSPHWGAVALGVVGRIVALLGRAPIALVLRRSNHQDDAHRFQRILAGASGVLEEPVRLGALFVVGLAAHRVPPRHRLGVHRDCLCGGQVIARSALAGRTDAEAEQAKQVLDDLGLGEALHAASPWWGVVERLSATALHLAFGLFYVAEPWLVLIGIPVHSAVHLGLTESLRRHRSLAALELVFLVVAAVLFVSSLVVTSR